VISFTTGGSTKQTEAYLRRLARGGMYDSIESAVRDGVDALRAATPVDSGLSSESWDANISISGASCTIVWTNSDVENGFPVAIMLQYGHGTGTGGYVQGQDYINPAMRPIFDRIEQQVRKAVTSS
jgi:hypothetical protein